MASLGRASAMLAAGTLVSRVTGLLRSVVLVAVIGLTAGKVAGPFTTATMLPSNVYELLAAGVITGIIVPQIVAAARHTDGGDRFISKLMTLGTVLLIVATLIVMALAPALIWLYAPGYTPDQRALTLALAYWCLPQLLFYGLYALIGEVLNARSVFGPYSWAPTVNNVVSIAGFGLFLAIYGGPHTAVADWDGGMIALLGGTATAGIALQAAVLLLFWKRTGVRVRADFGWRGMGLRHLGTLATWTFLSVVAGQVAGVVQQAILSTTPGGSGPAVFAYAWLIFMLPHSIVAMSISTVYFTRLAGHAADGRQDLIRDNLDESIRAVSVFAFGFLAAISAASVPISRVFADDAAGARQLAVTLCAFLIGLVPFGILVIVRRAFFAFQDTRLPFWFGLAQCVLAAAGALLAFGAAQAELLPAVLLTTAVALAQTLSLFVQLPLAVRMLRRHTGPLALGATWRALARFAAASVPAFLAGGGVFFALGGFEGWATTDRLLGAVGAALVGGAALVVYVAVLAVLRAPELQVAVGAVRRLTGR